MSGECQFLVKEVSVAPPVAQRLFGSCRVTLRLLQPSRRCNVPSASHRFSAKQIVSLYFRLYGYHPQSCPAVPPDEVLKDLAELQRRLSMMSQTAVEDFYQSAHMVCRIGPGTSRARGRSKSKSRHGNRGESGAEPGRFGARASSTDKAWYAVMKCVRPIDLRLRCKVLTWQELAKEVPRGLRVFLSEKYGIADVTNCVEN